MSADESSQPDGTKTPRLGDPAPTVPPPPPDEAETYRLSDPAASLADTGLAAPAAAAEAVMRGPRTAGSTDVWALIGCNLIVFVSNVCIMALELTASRLIAKHVGNSLYTWTSVIGVVLAGITIGNYLGGWLADRYAPRRTLGWLFFSASVLSISVLWLDQLIGGMDPPAGFSWPKWVLTVVAAMFLLPSVALGTISPVVAKLALSRSLKTGITVGNVYAWGALGSIVGTFLTGFYLIDLFGTKAIVAMTAGTLAVMGVIVSGGQRAFRAAVVFGWLQFLAVVGVMATATEPGMARVGEAFGKVVTLVFPGDAGHDGTSEAAVTPASRATAVAERVAFFRAFGAALGRDLQQLGLTLRLRDDHPGEYHDESQYSYIYVGDTFEDGDIVKYLRLDKLTHSYYNPEDPTALYYEYEQIYAAVTERIVEAWERFTRVPVAEFAGREELVSQLPDWIRWDARSGELVLQGALSPSKRDELLRLVPAGSFWLAVEELGRRTRTADAGDVTAIGVPLSQWPVDVALPPELDGKVRFDPLLGEIRAQGVISEEDQQRLAELAEPFAWYEAVQSLYVQSRKLSTLFIGGGGFIFPRWIETMFPGDPRIDVAEIDPAVKLAVQREMGLPPDDQTLVHTFIGDARNFVDLRLRENRKRRAAGQPPILYDFVYGDAFNDFSVPWHLTTLEFTQRVRELMSDDGAYLVNLIDIYPYTDVVVDVAGGAETVCEGPLPEALFEAVPSADDWLPATEPFDRLQAKAADEGRFRLRYDGVMTPEEFDLLGALIDPDSTFADALRRLFRQSNKPQHIPGDLIPEDWLRGGTLEWYAAADPFGWVELSWLDDERTQCALAVRGAMSDKQRERLERLAPDDQRFQDMVADLYERSRRQQPGRFLASYVNTFAREFPFVYVFSSEVGIPSHTRDTFVIVGANQRQFFENLGDAEGHWYGRPFAALESRGGGLKLYGQMESLLELARGLVLTDDYAPVDNLLIPVFAEQGD